MNIRALAGLLLVPIEYLHDSLRAFRWSKSSPFCPTQKQLHYDIMLLAHTVEKGLSVPSPRLGFGKDKIPALLDCLELYSADWPPFCLEKAYGCLSEYYSWHEECGYDLGLRGERILAFLKLCEDRGYSCNGGTKVVANNFSNNVSLESALLNRFSCRKFQSDIVSENILQKIGLMVSRVPSQCNRQSAKLHYYNDYESIQELLKLQGGAEGFRESVHNLFIISSDFSAWSGFKARSQAYVDGSLLAMQSMNALQSQGLGYCPLNLAISNAREKEICNSAGISKGERLVLMIAFGVPEECDFKVAKSARLKPFEILVKH